MEGALLKHESHTDLAEILRKGEGEVQFVVEQWHANAFPEKASEKGFEALPERVKERCFFPLTDACRMYYNGYVTNDPFGKDEGRRIAWQTQMLKSYKGDFEEFQRRIKLRIANITSVLGLFRRLVENLDNSDIHTEEAEKVRALFAELPKVETFISTPYDEITYEKMQYEQKLELVRKIDSVAGRFLALVTESRQTSVNQQAT